MGKWGYINKKGRVVIPIKWKDATTFERGAAEVEDESGTTLWIDKKGKEITE
jgi:bifunctional DNA-binding transcriptional regulator/antitoxin component of YhaV-PrlF toxin-antitoxin module